MYISLIGVNYLSEKGFSTYFSSFRFFFSSTLSSIFFFSFLYSLFFSSILVENNGGVFYYLSFLLSIHYILSWISPFQLPYREIHLMVEYGNQNISPYNFSINTHWIIFPFTHYLIFNLFYILLQKLEKASIDWYLSIWIIKVLRNILSLVCTSWKLLKTFSWYFQNHAYFYFISY